MAAPKLKKARGLYTASNRYDVPEGALVTATNVLIYKDGVIQPRWGLVPSSTSMVTGNVSHWHRGAELGGQLWYGGRDTVANTLKIGYGSPSAFAGVTALSVAEDGPDPYSGFTGSTTPFYDVEFLRAGNLLYYNCARGLIRIESSSVQRRAGNYPCAVSCFPRPISTSLSRTGSTTVTASCVMNHNYVPGLKVTMTSAGDVNFAAGEYTVVTASATSFTYVDATSSGTNSLASQTFTVSNIVGSSGFLATNDRVAYRAVLTEFDTVGNEYIGATSGRVVVTNASPFIGAGNLKNTQVSVLFPVALLASNTKVELYRSRTVNAAEPNDELQLVSSKFLSSAEIAQGFTWITDINPDSQLKKALHTNETQEGMGQNNVRAPLGKTVALWKDRLAVGSTFDVPQIAMQLLSVDSTSGGLVAGDHFVINTEVATITLVAIASGTAFSDVNQFTIFTGGTASVDVKHTVLSMLDSLNWSATPFAFGFVGVFDSEPTDWPGHFTIYQSVPTDQLEYSLTNNSALRFVTAKMSGTSTRSCFAPKLGSFNTVSGSITRASNVLSVTTASNHNFEVGEFVVCYSSAPTVATIGGTSCEGQITAKTATTLTISNTGSDGSTAAAQVGLKYMPRLQNNHQLNNVAVSRPSALEAFPPFNTVRMGSSSAKILKMVPCTDSLMVFKEDGLFRVTASGTLGENLSAELVDPNAILWAKDSAVAINGKVMAWLTKGVAIIGEQGVEKYVSSQRIDDKLAPATTRTAEPDLLAYPFSRRAQAFVDEKHNLYELRVCLLSGPSAPYASTVNLIYNTDNDTWVEDDLSVVSEVFYQGKRYIQQGTTFYAQDDKVYAGTNTTQTAFAAGAGTGVSDMYAYTNSGGTIPVGSYVVSDNSLVAIVLTSASGSGTIYAPSGVSGAASWTIYNSLLSTVQYAPITLGEENKLKRHQEVQLMFGVREQLTANLKTATELVTTTETNVCKLGAVNTSVGVNGFAPLNLRMGVPQQHRVAQQLQLTALIYTAYGPWTILGVGCAAQVLGPKVSR